MQNIIERGEKVRLRLAHLTDGRCIAHIQRPSVWFPTVWEDREQTRAFATEAEAIDIADAILTNENRPKTCWNWGQRPFGQGDKDQVEYLLETLGKYALDRIFERYGAFHYAAPELPNYLRGDIRFSGNFYTLSFSFCLNSSEPDIIHQLTTAIDANRRRPDYLAQPTPEEAQAAREERQRAEDAKRRERRRSEYESLRAQFENTEE